MRVRVLVVEDEALVAMGVEALLEDLGCEVLGPASTVEQALKLLATTDPDGVILDLNLGGEWAFPVAEELHRRHIPFVFATGHDLRPEQMAPYPDAVYLNKPYTDQDIENHLLHRLRPASHGNA